MHSAIEDLSPAERSLLADAASDDVSFDWVLTHLGLIPKSRTTDWRPGPSELDAAFSTLARLAARGLIRVGHTEYVDGGPPGRVAPVRHVEEPLSQVRDRVIAAVESARDASDWSYQCWVVAPV